MLLLQPRKNKILSHLHAISKALNDFNRNMIISSYWVFLTMSQKKNHVKFPKHLPFAKYCQTEDLFQNPR